MWGKLCGRSTEDALSALGQYPPKSYPGRMAHRGATASTVCRQIQRAPHWHPVDMCGSAVPDLDTLRHPLTS